MKKFLFSLTVFSVLLLNAQTVVFEYAFTGLTNNSNPTVVNNLPTGWDVTNQSAPVGTASWFAGNGAVLTAHVGGASDYLGANFNSTSGTGVISTWLITPVISLQNDDIISFWTRVPTGSSYADNLELRYSTNGAASAAPSGATGLGDYTNLAVTVNTVFPDPSGYPDEWTEFTHTVAGLAGPTDCRIAFRYTVPTSAGPSGDNSNYVGVDTFSVTRAAMAVSDVSAQANTTRIYPNPVQGTLNLKISEDFNPAKVKLTLYSTEGKQVLNADYSAHGVNVANLPAGVYMLEVTDGVKTERLKLIKK